jgi:hypothetical protein
MWKEVVVLLFEVLFRNFLGTSNVIRGRDFSLRPFEYETGMLYTQPRRIVLTVIILFFFKHFKCVRFFMMKMRSMGKRRSELNTKSSNELNSWRNEIAFLSSAHSLLRNSQRNSSDLPLNSLNNLVVYLSVGLSGEMRYQLVGVPHSIIPSQRLTVMSL